MEVVVAWFRAGYYTGIRLEGLGKYTNKPQVRQPVFWSTVETLTCEIQIESSLLEAHCWVDPCISLHNNALFHTRLFYAF